MRVTSRRDEHEDRGEIEATQHRPRPHSPQATKACLVPVLASEVGCVGVGIHVPTRVELQKGGCLVRVHPGGPQELRERRLRARRLGRRCHDDWRSLGRRRRIGRAPSEQRDLDVGKPRQIEQGDGAAHGDKHSRRRRGHDPPPARRPAEHLPRRSTHDRRRDTRPPGRVRAEQGPVADGVEQPRDAAREPIGDACGARIEDRLPLACDLHPMLHVRDRLLGGERTQVRAHGNPLGELTQLRPGQELLELGLADQDDLEELLPRRLDIRQQTNLLQDRRTQVLGLVDDQDGPTTASVSVEQSMGQGVDQDLEAPGPRWIGDPELVAHSREQLDRCEPGIEDHRDIDVRWQLLQKGAAHRGLSRTDFARQLHDATARADPVEQVGEGLAVSGAQIEVAWIRREGERPLGEPEV